MEVTYDYSRNAPLPECPTTGMPQAQSQCTNRSHAPIAVAMLQPRIRNAPTV